MRKFLALAIVGALTFGVVNLATAGEETQTEVGKIKPTKLPKKGVKNVKYVNTITTFNEPGKNQPKSANRTILDLPKQFKLNNKKFKTCKTDESGLEQAATTDDAVKACGKKSLVSDPKGSSAQVTVDFGTSSAIIDVEVSAFNESGNKLLLYSKPTGAGAGIAASILVGKLKKANKVAGRPSGVSTKGFKQSLDVTIPPLAAGAISFFEVTIPKNKTVKKGKGKKAKKVSYIQAKCKPKNVKWQATTFFTDGSNTTDDHVQKCKQKKK